MCGSLAGSALLTGSVLAASSPQSGGEADALASTPNAVREALDYGWTGPAPAHPFQNYSGGRALEQAMSVPLEFGVLVGAMTWMGMADWKWGSSDFHFHSEGWFGDNTGSGGSDKLGHMLSTYMLTDFLTYAIRRNASNADGAEITAAALALSLMFYVEIFDGLSVDHGFSREDIAMNVLGAGLSVLRNTVPGLKEKVDLRLEYMPSGYRGFRPVADYAGQKYLLALKLSGFEFARDTPLRFLELHAGYYARGYTTLERQDNLPRDRHLYFGVGLNLQELLFGAPAVKDQWWARGGRTFLEYVQIPYTAIDSK